MALTVEQARVKRDVKVRDTYAAYAPVWLENERFVANEESLLFNLVYLHEVDGWVSGRFKYDGFNDVLYHMGSRRLTEAETIAIQAHEPYIDGEVAAQPRNAPAFRAPRV
jgi:hypothetical protein